MSLKSTVTNLATTYQVVFQPTQGVESESSIHSLIFSNNTSFPCQVDVRRVTGEEACSLAPPITIQPKSAYAWPGVINVEDGEAIEARADVLGVTVQIASYSLPERPLVGFTPRGQWSVSSSYEQNDVVTYDGLTYVASKQTTAEAPSATDSTWLPLATGVGVVGYTGSTSLLAGPTPGYRGSMGYAGSAPTTTTPLQDPLILGYQGSRGPQGSTGSEDARITSIIPPVAPATTTWFYSFNTTNIQQIAAIVVSKDTTSSVTVQLRYGTTYDDSLAITPPTTVYQIDGWVRLDVDSQYVGANRAVYIDVVSVDGGVDELCLASLDGSVSLGWWSIAMYTTDESFDRTGVQLDAYQYTERPLHCDQTSSVVLALDFYSGVLPSTIQYFRTAPGIAKFTPDGYLDWCSLVYPVSGATNAAEMECLSSYVGKDNSIYLLTKLSKYEYSIFDPRQVHTTDFGTIIKFAPDGTLQWSKQVADYAFGGTTYYGGTSRGSGLSYADTDAAGNVYAIGSTLPWLSMWSQYYPNSDISRYPLFMKFDKDGNILKQKVANAYASDFGAGVLVRSNGMMYMSIIRTTAMAVPYNGSTLNVTHVPYVAISYHDVDLDDIWTVKLTEEVTGSMEAWKGQIHLEKNSEDVIAILDSSRYLSGITPDPMVPGQSSYYFGSPLLSIIRIDSTGDVVYNRCYFHRNETYFYGGSVVTNEHAFALVWLYDHWKNQSRLDSAPAVVCFDIATGDLLWTKTMFPVPNYQIPAGVEVDPHWYSTLQFDTPMAITADTEGNPIVYIGTYMYAASETSFESYDAIVIVKFNKDTPNGTIIDVGVDGCEIEIEDSNTPYIELDKTITVSAATPPVEWVDRDLEHGTEPLVVLPNFNTPANGEFTIITTNE